MENFEKTTADAKVSTRCSFSLDNEEFVGFKEEIEQIIQRLTGGTKERDVISIVGMGGLGKTTLAKKVYNNRSIADHFDVGAFCTISQRYSIRKLLAEILKQVTGEKRDIKEDEDVADLLRRALFCKRYLIVLDDIWNYEAWEELQFSFPSMERGSRIMVTTRVQELAMQISDPYFLRFLDEEESWELSQKKVFKHESCPSELVGFDNDAEIIIGKLVRGTREMDVISIVGMAGLGKTSLACKVYNNCSITIHFDVRVWCTVSQTYNKRNLLLGILRQIMGDKSDNVDDPGDVLRKHLMGRRYLVVLDDIWEPQAWDDLGLCFPCRENGSRIMVTTRNEELARYIKHHSDPYLLPFLRDEDSWELLQKKVFQGESCPSELLNVGPLVAKKCKGLPYLIIMIAGILSRKKREPSLWLEIAYDISSHALAEESMKVIQLSYDCLEDHLKSCLLYMGLFPKGYEIPVSDLLKWWIAEEFVQNIDMLELEETSKSFLDDLVNRNLVVVSKRRASGEMKCCIVLDQVREFCLRKITEEKFMQLIVPYNPHQTLDLNEQRLCMYIHDTLRSDSKERESFGNSQGSLEFIVHPKFRISDRKNPFGLLNNLRCIRVLYLLNIYLGSSWATAFKSLTQLRYLALYVKVFDVKWVSHLLHLQTLRVRSSYIMMSPAIWKMKKLRHVDISEFSITWEEDDEQVINLRTLGLCYVSVTDMTPKFWGKFPNLEELKLHIDVFGDITNYSVSDQLMRLEMFPRRLKVLSLNDIFLTDEIVSSIAKLVHLETLKLSEIYFTGEKIWDLNDNQFYRLKVLKLHRVFMTRWICSDESFPMLEKLIIKSCSKLEEIPFSFVEIPTLELIKVIDCSDSVEISALNIEKEAEEFGWEIQVHISKKD